MRYGVSKLFRFQHFCLIEVVPAYIRVFSPETCYTAFKFEYCEDDAALLLRTNAVRELAHLFLIWSKPAKFLVARCVCVQPKWRNEITAAFLSKLQCRQHVFAEVFHWRKPYGKRYKREGNAQFRFCLHNGRIQDAQLWGPAAGRPLVFLDSKADVWAQENILFRTALQEP